LYAESRREGAGEGKEKKRMWILVPNSSGKIGGQAEKSAAAALEIKR